MKEKLRICVIGCGRFAKHFVPLFKAHPFCEKVGVCDLKPERAKDYSEKFNVPVAESFEKVLSGNEYNAVAIFTSRQQHGPMVISALKAGKNVYSAVPCTVNVDEIKEIARLVKETRLTYSMGETGYYRPQAIYLRKLFRDGVIGKFVYGEAQYNHDIRNMEDSYKSSGGADWEKYAGIPPFYYPTHSTAMILSTMPGVYAKRVVGMGYVEQDRTNIFGTDGQNFYNNPFSNQSMLVELSNGGIMRINENRGLCWKAPETYVTQYYGTKGSYEFSVASHYLATRKEEDPKNVNLRNVTKGLIPESIYRDLNDKETYQLALDDIASGGRWGETSPVQDTSRLPKEFEGLDNFHNGTHHFIIDDFCKAYMFDKLSPTNIWEVARYNIPGLIANESIKQGSIPMDVPDLGNPPDDWERLEF